jgi:hypothetical protein
MAEPLSLARAVAERPPPGARAAPGGAAARRVAPIRRKTWQWLGIAGAVLCAATAIAVAGSRGLDVAAEELKRIAQAEQQERALRAAVEKYERALALVGGQPGAEVRRDPVSISASLSQDQALVLNQILASTYEEQGVFLMRNFNLNTGGGSALTVSFDGQKLVTYVRR